MGSLLSGCASHTNESQDWANSQEFSWQREREDSQEFAWSGQAARHLSLVGFGATATMVIARPILMGAPPPGPLTDQGSRGGSRPDEAGQQMPHFRGGQ